MNIVVLGAGALGVYYGTRLQEAGGKVTYLVREGRATQLKEHGVSITSTGGDVFYEEVDYTTNVDSITSVDLVLIGLKGYHLQEALPQIKRLTDKGAYVLPLLNGIEHIEILQNYVGKERVLGGLAFIIATLDEKGHVHHTSDFHRFVFGPLIKEQKPFCEKLAELANQATIEVIHTEKVLYELWKKYMYITAFSGITTATNEPIGILQGNEATQRTTLAILEEMQTLANTYNIMLGEKEIKKTMDSFLKLSGETTSSMHQDRRKGLRIEVDHLQGGALRLAKAKQITLPTIEAVYGILTPFEHPND